MSSIRLFGSRKRLLGLRQPTGSLRLLAVAAASLVLLFAFLPIRSEAQSNSIKEAIRKQESSRDKDERPKPATGDSKAHRKARKMIEHVRGPQASTGPAEAMAPDEVGKRMEEVEGETNYLFLALAGIPVLLALLFLLKFLFNVFLRPVVRPARGYAKAQDAMRPSKSQLRRLVSVAKRYARKGQLLEAAQMFESADEMQAVLAGLSIALVETPESRPYMKNAAELYERSGSHKKASELYEKLRVPNKTKELCLLQAKEYESESKFLQAAEMYAKAQDYSAAAAMNEAGGHFHGAAAYYEKVGEQRKAAELYEKFYRQERTERSGQFNDQQAHDYVRKYGLKSAKLYAAAGEFIKAASVFAELSEHVAAGKMYLKANRASSAIEVLVKTDDVDLLKEALAQADIDKMNPELLATAMAKIGDVEAAAQQLIKAGRIIEAASLFERMGKLDKAAEIYEQNGELQTAAELFAGAGEFERAAQLYVKVNDMKAATEMYRRLGNVQKVAEMKASAGHFLDAAREFFAQGDSTKAIAMLQRIEPGQPDFMDATRLLGEHLMREGRYQMVRNVLERALPALKPRSHEAAEIYYMLAHAFMKEKMVEKAKECLEHVLDIDYSFKDASNLYDFLLADGPGKRSGSGA